MVFINIFVIFLLSLFIIFIVYSYMVIFKYKYLKYFNKCWIGKFVNWMECMVKGYCIVIYIIIIVLFCISIIGIYNIKFLGSFIEDMLKNKFFF